MAAECVMRADKSNPCGLCQNQCEEMHHKTRSIASIITDAATSAKPDCLPGLVHTKTRECHTRQRRRTQRIRLVSGEILKQTDFDRSVAGGQALPKRESQPAHCLRKAQSVNQKHNSSSNCYDHATLKRTSKRKQLLVIKIICT
jgi:hypothetical protein